MKKINTPICAFLEKYASEGKIRMHMPGHKGRGNSSELYDITEVQGADSLYDADGIIRESEMIAGSIFGANTFYSAEGSSLSIRAMIYLVGCYARLQNRPLRIAAGRNAHKAFLSAVSFLDAEVDWLLPQNSTYLSCAISARDVAEYLDTCAEMPVAVYITSPDYLGNISDVQGIAQVCHQRGVVLLVDNAHGAYLKFLPESQHPVDLGADMCCDSAHKTLPVITGGAYLHISHNAPEVFFTRAKDALAAFGSTSPSYLIMASLDKANERLSDCFADELLSLTHKLDNLKEKLVAKGYTLSGNEPMKLTVFATEYGYSGYELAEILRCGGIECEFADPDFAVLMPSVNTSDDELECVLDTLLGIERRETVAQSAPIITLPKMAMLPQEAMLLPSEYISVEDSIGRVLAAVTIGCPPAVPIVVSGEVIDESAVRCFEYYGIKKVCVIKKEYI